MLLLRYSLFVLLFINTSCGFQPMYSDGNWRRNLSLCLNEDAIISEDKITKSQFINALSQLITIDSSNCDLTLSGTIKEHYAPFIIRKDASVDRYIVSITFDYIVDLKSGKRVTGHIHTSETLKSSQNDFATHYSKRSVKKNLLSSLAEDFVIRLFIINQNESSK